MLDQLLMRFGLTKYGNLETMYDGLEEALYHLRITYDVMNDLLNYDLPSDAKIEVNKYLADHDWIVKNVVIAEQE